MIVDDDADDRALMARVLTQVGYATRQVSTADETLAAARQEPPRLVILEVCLGSVSGYDLCRQLRESFGDELPIMFVSARRAESHDRVAGFLAGGDDFLVKPFAQDEFVARVRRLLERTEARSPSDSGLTRREIEVLSLVAQGLARAEISRRLFISPNTVRTHLERIFRKLGVHTRAEAVAFAYEQGLLPTAASAAGRSRESNPGGR